MSRKLKLQKHLDVAVLYIIRLFRIEKITMSRRKSLSVKQTVIITVTGN